MLSLPLAALALLAFWLPIIYLFAGQWAGYASYTYGWAVPVLCLYLFARRWRIQPAPQFPARRNIALTIIVLFSIVLLPAYIVQEASPIWRAASWVLAISASAITLAVIYLRGGLPWLKHFAFPVLFFLVAVPWPSAVEVAVIDSLTRVNTTLVIEALNAFGVAAIKHGNVIELATGMVGVDEACSGIRSTQANFMLALFFGEQGRLSLRSRCALLACGFGFAVVFNFGRTLLLSGIASTSGLQAIERWHDPAGTVVLVACFVALWVTALWMRRRNKPNPETTSVDRIFEKESGLGPAQFGALKGCLFALGAWGLFVPIASEIWFRSHGRGVAQSLEWTVRWPALHSPPLQTISLSKAVRELLRFDEGNSVMWREVNGTRWQMFFFRWQPAQNIFRRVEIQFAKNHRPERCLPASGRVLTERPRSLTVNTAGFSLPFLFYRFDDQGVPLHVYLCVQDANTPPDTLANMRVDSMDRLLAALRGNRATGQQLIEVAIWGIPDAERSRAELERQLTDFIEPSSNARIK